MWNFLYILGACFSAASLPIEDDSKKNELRGKLTELQYKVTQENETEPAFENLYWNNQEKGIYVDLISGEALFSTVDQYDTGTGRPCFHKPLEDANIVEKSDGGYFGGKSEIRSLVGNAHLGHVFGDGPEPTGLRYCINSASVRFVPFSKMKDEGYAGYLYQFDSTAIAPTREIAYFAGGCFWGVEQIVRKIPGVLETQVGYTGGTVTNPTYETIKTGKTGHAESVKVVFDRNRLSYADLLGYFFRLHDPTTLNRQGNDKGDQYRSAIFYITEQQRKTAEKVIQEVDVSKKWSNPVVTTISLAGDFYPAEGYHQDYLVLQPDGYTCHYLRD